MAAPYTMPQKRYTTSKGQVITFPADATPDEMQEIVDRLDPPAPPEPSMMERAGDFVKNIPSMVRGNASENLESIYSPKFEQYTGENPLQRLGAAAKSVPATIFGSDEDVAAKAIESVPGAEMSQDENGNPVIVTPDGKRFYVNQPGLDKTDALRLGANIASYGPAVATGAAPASLLGRAALTGGLSSLTNLGGQMAGRDQVDLGEAATTGAFGAGGVYVSPAFKWAKGMIAKQSGSVPKDSQVIQTIREQLQLAPDVPDAQVLKMADEIRAGANPAAVGGQNEFGFQYTQGQKTGNFQQLSKEEMLRQSQGIGGDIMRNVGSANENALTNALSGIRSRYGMPEGNPAQMVESVSGRVKSAADALDTQIGDAYGKVGAARVGMGAVKTLPDRVRGALREMPIDPELTPATVSVIKRIESMAGQPNTTALSLKAIDGQRRIINNSFGTAKNPTDKRALTMLKREYDKWMDDAFESALVKGDDKALAELRNAQQLRAEYAKRFESNGGSEIDDLVENMVQGGRTPEELLNSIYGMGQVSKASSGRFIGRLKVALKDDQASMNELKAAHFDRMTMGKNGERLGPQAIRNNILKTERENGTMVFQLYSPEEWATMKRLADAVNPLIPKGDFGRTSGSSERLARMLGASAQLPWVKTAVESLNRPVEYMRAASALSPVKKVQPRATAVPVGSIEAGQSYYRNQ